MTALRTPSIRTIVIVAEGVPERQVKKLIFEARKCGKMIIGPATVGGIQAGAFKIGYAAGPVDNVLRSKLYRPGSVGLVTKSGGLSNEMYNLLSTATDGLFEGIAIGGDVFPGSTLLDHVRRFERIEEIKMIVVLGEIGGESEYEIVAAVKKGEVTKPVVAWVSGTCASIFPTEVQFGHAGAKSGSERGSARAKIAAMKEVGIRTPESFEDFAKTISMTFHEVKDDKMLEVGSPPPISLPSDIGSALKKGQVRKRTNFVSTICDERGDEPVYAGIGVTQLIGEGATVGDIISLLWFKRRLPKYATRFIELCLILTADHGPCVSGAHNTIVAARAGKDVVDSVAAGLLTIGPRFGGAIDDAAKNFKSACDEPLSPEEFVEDMKRKGLLIPGIGHRVKSLHNPDARVAILKKYAKENFPSTRYLEYALRVEQLTLQKSIKLILNVDGTIGALFLDLMEGSGSFGRAEMDAVLESGCLNGLFVLARSIGLIGHALDQKRLRQPLYRHPWDDVMYTDVNIVGEVESPHLRNGRSMNTD